jgi:hypothetical protein
VQLPLIIPVRRSGWLSMSLLVAHLVAAGAVVPLPWAARLALLGMVAISLMMLLGRQRRQPVAALILGKRGELEVQTKVGARETATIGSLTTVLPWLIVLWVNYDGKRLALPLLTDAVGVEQHRQLRVWLQWRAKVGVSASA